MKRGFVAVLVALAMAGAAGTALMVDSASAEIKLTYNNYFPPTHRMAQLGAEFSKEIEKRTNGKVKIAYYAGGTLMKAPQVFDGVAKGVADIGMSNLSYTRGRFPEMEICDLPFGCPSGWVSTQMVDKFYREAKPKGFEKVQPLYFHACGPNIIYTASVPVKALSDMKGLTIRGTGRIADTVEALGATSHPIAMPEAYEALSRNVISGVMGPMEMLKGWRTGEVAKFATNCWEVGNVYTFYVVMNKAKYDKLPPDVKKVFDEVSAEWVQRHAVAWNEIDEEGKEFFASKGGKVINLSKDEAAKWIEAVQPVIQGYEKDMVSKGMKADTVKERVALIRKTVKDLTQAQKEKGIKSPYTD
ncbi:MAG: TRAP transporter substrate-binding protein [Pseudomonadota bacterium]